MSTSLPIEIQLAAIHSIPGLGNRRNDAPRLRHRIRFYRPTELDRTLETKKIAGLFLADKSTERAVMKKPPAKA